MARCVRRHERSLGIVSTVFVGAQIALSEIGFCAARNVGAGELPPTGVSTLPIAEQ
jgi:hypothetical protein